MRTTHFKRPPVMTKPSIKLLRVLLLLLACWASAAHSANKELIIVFPGDIPPWTIERENRGIALDIMREALGPYGYTIIPSYFPLSRMAYAMHANMNIDGVAMVEGGKIRENYYFYSEN